MTADAIVAPTDAQLGYIAELCRRNGFPIPARQRLYGVCDGDDSVSHEWDCRCPRCRADMQAWVDRDDDQAEQEAAELEDARYGARVPDAD